MLDEKDLQMIQEMLDRSVEQTVGRTESRLVAYIESAVMPKFDLLADGHKTPWRPRAAWRSWRTRCLS